MLPEANPGSSNPAPGEPGYQMISAHVPLATMFGYTTDLRNKTQGRATYTMEFERYSEVPQQTAQEIIKKSGGTYIQ